LLHTYCDGAANISLSIINKTVVRSRRSAWVPHELVLKNAPASIGGVGCGFLKDVNRLLPEADRHFFLVSRLRMCVRGALPKLPQYVFIKWCFLRK